MFYIVRIYADGQIYDSNFDELDDAASFMAQTEYFAELYVWLGGEEKYMGSNRDR